MFTLNLPPPSKELTDLVYQDLRNALENHVYFWESNENWPLGGCENISPYQLTNPAGTQEYQQYFEEPINACVLLFVPDGRTPVSELFPHVDLRRKIGINYLLEPGGDNVTTTMFTEEADANTSVNDLRKRESLEVLESFCIPPNTWYGLNGMRYHSVENVTKNRVVFTLSISDIEHETFVNKYQHLISSYLS